MYEKSFSAISERYFKASPWPSVEAIARFADNDHVFCLLYKEMYFRHVYSKVRWCAAEKGVDQHRGIGGFFFFFFSSVFFSLPFSVHIFPLIFFVVAREKSHEPLEREDDDTCCSCSPLTRVCRERERERDRGLTGVFSTNALSALVLARLVKERKDG